MERNLPWNTNASPVGRFEDGNDNNGTSFINIYDSQSGQGNLIRLLQHNCNGGRWFAIPPSAYHLIVGNPIPVLAPPGVQSTLLDQENTHGSHISHGTAQAYQTARPSNVFAGPRSRSFHANLQHALPLQAGNLLPPRYPQPHADLGTAQAPPTDLFEVQLGSSPFGSTPEWNHLLAVQGPREHLHGASPQAFRHRQGLSSANASIVPEHFPRDNHHPVDFSSSHPFFNNSARHSSSPGAISSTKDALQEPLGPMSIQSVNAQRAAMAQDLGEMIESSQPKGDYTGGHLHATDGRFYRGQAFESVSENDRSMPMSDLLLAEGYGHRDPQVPFQEAHPEPVSQGPAPGEAGARKRSQAPRSVAGSASHTKRKKGGRHGPLPDAVRVHANGVKKRNRKDCFVHKQKKITCTCDDDNDDDPPVALEQATRPANTLLQPRRHQDDPAYGSPNTPTSLDSSFFTGPATNTRSTPSRNRSFTSYEAATTPADAALISAMRSTDLRTSSVQTSHEQASIDNDSIDADGETDYEAT